mgnify:CR=1 FL=1
MSTRPLIIGVSARIYYPGSQGPLQGVFTKTLHYLEQSVAHWVLSGHAMAVMVPAVTQDSVVRRSDLDLHDYAEHLGFDIEARCPEDGMIEAIRRVEGPYMAAVQWHPEFHDPADTGTFDDTPMLEDFLAACRAARQETAR